MRDSILGLGVFSLAILLAAVTHAQQGASGDDGKQQGWKATPERSAAQTERRPEFIYYEEKVPEYSLPELLAMADGTKVTDADAWRTRRRPEILESFRMHVYGRAPIERPGKMAFDVGTVDPQALDGKVTRTDLVVDFTGEDDGPKMDMRVYVPNDADGPVPTFLYLGRSLSGDSRSQGRWSDVLPMLLTRGYGLAIIDRSGADPDDYDEFKNGVHGAFDGPGARPPDAWGTIGAWAWALSRGLDYLETRSDIDSERVVVMGVSRGGKTALWAGARDERFAMTISICSGCGGAALSRRRFGETVQRINASFPHWFCDNFGQYDGKEDELPLDQHMLIALMAPRLVYVTSADEDLWADPHGEFLSARHASPAYGLFGLKGLAAERMPALDTPIHGGRIGHHIRTGGHGLNEYDWRQFLDFADRHLKRADT